MSNHRLLTGSGAPPVSIPVTCCRRRPSSGFAASTELSTSVQVIVADPPVSGGDQLADVNDGPERLPRRSRRPWPPGRSASPGLSTGTSKSTTCSPVSGFLVRSDRRADAARTTQQAHSTTAASRTDSPLAPWELSAGPLSTCGSLCGILNLPNPWMNSAGRRQCPPSASPKLYA